MSELRSLVSIACEYKENNRTNGIFTTLEALEYLVNAEAHLLVEYGAAGILKEGPAKRATQDFSYARDKVMQSLIRERTAFYSDKTPEVVDAEITGAALAFLADVPKPPVTNSAPEIYERTMVGE